MHDFGFLLYIFQELEMAGPAMTSGHFWHLVLSREEPGLVELYAAPVGKRPHPQASPVYRHRFGSQEVLVEGAGTRQQVRCRQEQLWAEILPEFAPHCAKAMARRIRPRGLVVPDHLAGPSLWDPALAWALTLGPWAFALG